MKIGQEIVDGNDAMKLTGESITLLPSEESSNLFEGLSTGKVARTINRDGDDAVRVKEAVESIFS